MPQKKSKLKLKWGDEVVNSQKLLPGHDNPCYGHQGHVIKTVGTDRVLVYYPSLKKEAIREQNIADLELAQSL